MYIIIGTLLKNNAFHESVNRILETTKLDVFFWWLTLENSSSLLKRTSYEDQLWNVDVRLFFHPDLGLILCICFFEFNQLLVLRFPRFQWRALNLRHTV